MEGARNLVELSAGFKGGDKHWCLGRGGLALVGVPHCIAFRLVGGGLLLSSWWDSCRSGFMLIW